MKTLITKEIIPDSAENISTNEALSASTETDIYYLINAISFEKSFSRLQDNYLISSKLNLPDGLSHHQ